MDTNTAAVVAAVCAAIGVVLTVTSMVMTIVKDRRAERTASDAERARWTLALRDKGTDEVRRAVISYAGLSPLFFIERVAVMSPNGARIAKLVRGEQPMLGAAPVSVSPDGFRKHIAWGAHLPTEVSFAMPSRTQIKRHELEFFVVVPSRPWWSRSAETRLRISLTMEESAGLRRRKAITIISRPMAWTARSEAIAT